MRRGSIAVFAAIALLFTPVGGKTETPDESFYRPSGNNSVQLTDAEYRQVQTLEAKADSRLRQIAKTAYGDRDVLACLNITRNDGNRGLIIWSKCRLDIRLDVLVGTPPSATDIFCPDQALAPGKIYNFIIPGAETQHIEVPESCLSLISYVGIYSPDKRFAGDFQESLTSVEARQGDPAAGAAWSVLHTGIRMQPDDYCNTKFIAKTTTSSGNVPEPFSAIYGGKRYVLEYFDLPWNRVTGIAVDGGKLRITTSQMRADDILLIEPAAKDKEELDYALDLMRKAWKRCVSIKGGTYIP